MNVVLVGEGAAGIQAMRALGRVECRISAVITSPPRPEASGLSLWSAAAGAGIETIPAVEVRSPSLAARIREFRADLLVNVYSLYIIHPEVLAAARLGSYNVHPGPLPRYAGLNSMCWAIYRGEASHGVTLHEMLAEIDAGPIVYQTVFPVGEEETGLGVATRCIREGVELVRRLVETAIRTPREIPHTPQDLSRREYFGRGVPQEGILDWTRSARDVVNFVRACEFHPLPSPWGTPRSWLGARILGIARASRTGDSASAAPGTVDAGPADSVRVACGDEWVVVHRLLVDGRMVPAASVLRAGNCIEGTVSPPECREDAESIEDGGRTGPAVLVGS